MFGYFLSQIKAQDFNITKEILVLDLSWESYYSQEICPFVLNGQITSVTGPLKFYFKIQTEMLILTASIQTQVFIF